VTEIAIERDPAAHSTLAAIYGALSHETMPVQYIEAVLLGRDEALFIDEEGAIKERYACGRARRWFRLQGYHNVLAGKGLILAATTRAPSARPATALPRSLRWSHFSTLRSSRNTWLRRGSHGPREKTDRPTLPPQAQSGN
jgi:hypothetical protein